jgi:predicted HTH transcriptional regulator
MSKTDETKETRRDEVKEEIDDGEYVAVLRDLEPAGTAEFAEQFDVTQGTARRRLENLRERNASVDSKKIGGSYVWFVDEAGLNADATATAEEVRRRMGVE